MRRLGNRVIDAGRYSESVSDIYPEEVDIILNTDNEKIQIRQDLLSVNTDKQNVTDISNSNIKKYVLTEFKSINKSFEDFLTETEENDSLASITGPCVYYIIDTAKRFAILSTEGSRGSSDNLFKQTLYYNGRVYVRKEDDNNSFTPWESDLVGQRTEAGGEIFNDYENNKAEGYYSHAEGSSTTAEGYAAHAEGSGTIAEGAQSHAEGYKTYSSKYSHAEGIQSRAEGENSHAEGNSVTAKGNNSHAEGLGTKAEGKSSHTEGNNTKAKGENSHAEGYLTEAYGNYSHAEGNSNGHLYSGEYNKDDIVSSFKDTPFSMAFGQGSHVEGQTNLATGNGSHAEGLQNIAAGDGSHAEGRRTIASGEYQHVQGKYNVEDTTDTYAHIVGGGTSINNRKNIHTIDWNGNAEFVGDVFGGKAETELTIGNTLNAMRGEATIADYGLEIIIYYEYMDKFNAVKEMELTINSVSYTIPKNKLIPTNIIQSPGLFGDEKGGYIYLYKVIDHYPDIDTDYIDANNIDVVATVVDGYNLNKNGNAEFAGKVNASDLSIKGKSVSELIVGKKIINGGEIFNDYNNNIASGYYSHAEGYGTKATNWYAHAEGYETKASGLRSHTEGSASEAHGEGSHAEGRITKSTGQYAHSEGLLVEAYGLASHAEGDSNNKSYSGTDYTSKAIIDAFNTKSFSMAFGRGSHIEGQTNLAIGQSSHAEGANNIAKTNYSHVEGTRNISSVEYQHVEGKYNVEDPTKAHIVGGGTSIDKRKNIHSLDWSGNAEFAGDVYVKTSGVRTNNNKLITTKEMNDAIKKGLDDIVNGAPENLNTLQELSNALKGDADFGTKVVNKLEDIENNATGEKIENGGEIFNDYENNVASGALSHAEGQRTEAIGNSSHAEGFNTYAEGRTSHAEGSETYAIGMDSHAEGFGSSAEGNYSHAEGQSTDTIGYASHSEGHSTKATGAASHAEGLETQANGENAHAEGRYTTANIKNSHTEGQYTETLANAYRIASVEGTTVTFTDDVTLVTDGVEAGMMLSFLNSEYKFIAKILEVINETTVTLDESHVPTKITLDSEEIIAGIQVMIDGGAYGNEAYEFEEGVELSSHAEGKRTKAYVHGHAEGRESEARGHASHAEGRNTIAHGEYSHTEGYYSITKESVAHAEGYYTLAEGAHSHTEGRETKTTAENAHAEGRGTIASGLNSHAEGRETEAIGENAHAEGYKTKAHATQSHAEGQRTEAIGILSHTEGNLSKAESEGAHAEGYATIANGVYSHAEGYNSKTAANYAHAEGSSNTASGLAAHAEGSANTASGELSHVEGGGNTASAKAAHAEGYLTTASEAQAHSEGRSTKATGAASHAEGLETQANGGNAHSEGYKTIAGAGNSHAEGDRTIASSANQHVQGKFNVEDKTGTYAHIVGGGTSIDKRKNIHTVDWDGNAYYAGDMEVSAVVIRSSTPGSNKKFKLTIDDSGTISVSEI